MSPMLPGELAEGLVPPAVAGGSVLTKPFAVGPPHSLSPFHDYYPINKGEITNNIFKVCMYTGLTPVVFPGDLGSSITSEPYKVKSVTFKTSSILYCKHNAQF